MDEKPRSNYIKISEGFDEISLSHDHIILVWAYGIQKKSEQLIQLLNYLIHFLRIDEKKT